MRKVKSPETSQRQSDLASFLPFGLLPFAFCALPFDFSENARKTLPPPAVREKGLHRGRPIPFAERFEPVAVRTADLAEGNFLLDSAPGRSAPEHGGDTPALLAAMVIEVQNSGVRLAAIHAGMPQQIGHLQQIVSQTRSCFPGGIPGSPAGTAVMVQPVATVAILTEIGNRFPCLASRAILASRGLRENGNLLCRSAGEAFLERRSRMRDRLGPRLINQLVYGSPVLDRAEQPPGLFFSIFSIAYLSSISSSKSYNIVENKAKNNCTQVCWQIAVSRISFIFS